jgi:hypothetical protein
VERLESGILLFDVEYPARSSRLSIFLKWLLVIPHLFVLYVFGFLVAVTTFLAWFAILVTGRYPRGLWDFGVAYQMWYANVMVYGLNLRDEYPPFGAGPYPLQFDLVYPQRLSRLLIFVKWLLIIPHLVVLMLVGIGVAVVYIVSWFAILVLGRYPRGMHEFMTGALRWVMRVNIYSALLTDRYPPFSME